MHILLLGCQITKPKPQFRNGQRNSGNSSQLSHAFLCVNNLRTCDNTSGTTRPHVATRSPSSQLAGKPCRISWHRACLVAVTSTRHVATCTMLLLLNAFPHRTPQPCLAYSTRLRKAPPAGSTQPSQRSSCAASCLRSSAQLHRALQQQLPMALLWQCWRTFLPMSLADTSTQQVKHMCLQSIWQTS